MGRGKVLLGTGTSPCGVSVTKLVIGTKGAYEEVAFFDSAAGIGIPEQNYTEESSVAAVAELTEL